MLCKNCEFENKQKLREVYGFRSYCGTQINSDGSFKLSEEQKQSWDSFWNLVEKTKIIG